MTDQRDTEPPELTAFLDEPCAVCGRTWRQEGPGGNKRESGYARRHWHEIKYRHQFHSAVEEARQGASHGGEQ